jgi:hypothetical protein
VVSKWFFWAVSQNWKLIDDDFNNITKELWDLVVSGSSPVVAYMMATEGLHDC